MSAPPSSLCTPEPPNIPPQSSSCPLKLPVVLLSVKAPHTPQPTLLWLPRPYGWALPVLELDVNEITYCVLFSIWLLSLTEEVIVKHLPKCVFNDRFAIVRLSGSPFCPSPGLGIYSLFAPQSVNPPRDSPLPAASHRGSPPRTLAPPPLCWLPPAAESRQRRWHRGEARR